MEPNHAILHRYPMQKGLLVIQEIGVRQPQLVSYSVVQGQVERKVVICQAFVPPALLEVHGDGVVLGEKHANVSLAPGWGCNSVPSLLPLQRPLVGLQTPWYPNVCVHTSTSRGDCALFWENGNKPELSRGQNNIT